MTAIFLLLGVLILSTIITKVGAIALMKTGLSQEAAYFQSRSAYTGVGYTTSEAETVLKHPVRRHIIQMLMLVGHLGVATVAATVFASMLDVTHSTNWWKHLLVFITGIVTLWFVGRNRWIDKQINFVIQRTLNRFSDLEMRDYVGLLHFSNGYIVSELKVEEGDWLAGRELKELRLTKEGVLILGIEKADGKFIGTPEGFHVIEPDDVLIVYARNESLKDLDERSAGMVGESAHRRAVLEQARATEEEREEERTKEA